MWPVDDVLLFPLPDSFQAFEDEHSFEVRCRRCGWTATFSATGAAIKEITASVQEHRCPAPAPRLCARCKRPIGEQTRCLFCGSENPYWPPDE